MPNNAVVSNMRSFPTLKQYQFMMDYSADPSLFGGASIPVIVTNDNLNAFGTHADFAVTIFRSLTQTLLERYVKPCLKFEETVLIKLSRAVLPMQDFSSGPKFRVCLTIHVSSGGEADAELSRLQPDAD